MATPTEGAAGLCQFLGGFIFISLGDVSRSELLGHIGALCLDFRVFSREAT